jgi:ferrous iron transport protein B
MVATLEAPRTSAQLRLALIGNPNTGKTTLFNALCGMRAKTSNYPGTTTTIRVGTAVGSVHQKHEVVDVPGLYDVRTDTPEGKIAADVLSRTGQLASDVVVVVVDADAQPGARGRSPGPAAACGRRPEHDGCGDQPGNQD